MKQKAEEIGEKIAKEGCPENGWHKDLILEFVKEMAEKAWNTSSTNSDNWINHSFYTEPFEDWWKQKEK